MNSKQYDKIKIHLVNLKNLSVLDIEFKELFAKHLVAGTSLEL